MVRKLRNKTTNIARPMADSAAATVSIKIQKSAQMRPANNARKR